MEIPTRSEDVLPEGLLEPGGILQALMDYMEAGGAASHALFNLAAAVTLLGGVAGQKIMTETGLRTNMYCCSLGYSGSGKDAPMSLLPLLLSRTTAHGLLGPNSVTSDAAILKRLSVSGRENQIFLLDEIGHLMKGLKNPLSHAAGVPAILMQLFSGTDRQYVKPYATGDEIVVRWHHVSLYGTSTPQRFWESLTPGEVTDGFLARLLIFESRHDAPKPKSRVDTEPPEGLIERVEAVHQMKPASHQGGNLQKIPVPTIVPKTEAAFRFFEEWSDRYHELKNRTKEAEDGKSAIYGRVAEHAHKLALIHALSLHGPDVVEAMVDEGSVRWAAGLMDWMCESMIRQVERNVAYNEYHASQQRIVRLIGMKATKERPGVSQRELLQSVRGVSKKQMEELLGSLEASGSVCTVPHKPPRGKEVLLYCLARTQAEGEMRRQCVDAPSTDFFAQK